MAESFIGTRDFSGSLGTQQHSSSPPQKDSALQGASGDNVTPSELQVLQLLWISERHERQSASLATLRQRRRPNVCCANGCVEVGQKLCLPRFHPCFS